MLRQFTKLPPHPTPPPSFDNYDNKETEDDTEGVHNQAQLCRHGSKCKRRQAVKKKSMSVSEVHKHRDERDAKVNYAIKQL